MLYLTSRQGEEAATRIVLGVDCAVIVSTIILSCVANNIWDACQLGRCVVIVLPISYPLNICAAAFAHRLLWRRLASAATSAEWATAAIAADESALGETLPPNVLAAKLMTSRTLSILRCAGLCWNVPLYLVTTASHIGAALNLLRVQ